MYSSVGQLVAGQPHLGRVDDDDEVAGIDVRREARRCACRAARSRPACREPAEHLPVGVGDVPAARGARSLGRDFRRACRLSFGYPKTRALPLGPHEAGPTRLELATSGVTGRRSNQLNYDPVPSLLPETCRRGLAEHASSCNRTRHRRPPLLRRTRPLSSRREVATMEPTLDFWFEFASTYSYPAAARIEDVARRAGVRVAWRPFLLGPIFGARAGTIRPFNIYPVKGRYMWRDLERICARLERPVPPSLAVPAERPPRRARRCAGRRASPGCPASSAPSTTPTSPRTATSREPETVAERAARSAPSRRRVSRARRPRGARNGSARRPTRRSARHLRRAVVRRRRRAVLGATTGSRTRSRGVAAERRALVATRASSTRSIRARSSTPTATASATSRASARRLDHLVVARRRRALALADLPLADGGLRLRRRRLLRRRPAVRLARRLRPRWSPRRTRAGLRVLLDWVPNHTSDRHPWFVESRASRDEPEARLVRLARPGARRRPAQQLDGRVPARHAGVDARPGDRRSTTCTCSCPSSPTSNWRTPTVVEAMHDVLRFWLDRGVDGFRVDVVHAHRQGPGAARRAARASPASRTRR